MVEEHELQKEKIQEDYNDKYWDQRYTIVQHRIPSFLQKMADKILSTGLDSGMQIIDLLTVDNIRSSDLQNISVHTATPGDHFRGREETFNTIFQHFYDFKLITNTT